MLIKAHENALRSTLSAPPLLQVNTTALFVLIPGYLRKPHGIAENFKPKHTDGVFPSDKSRKQRATGDNALRTDTAAHGKQTQECVSKNINKKARKYPQTHTHTLPIDHR